MGGSGSGRYYRTNRRATVDEFLKLSINAFRKKGRWRFSIGTITSSKGGILYASIFCVIEGNAITLSWRNNNQETITQDITLNTSCVGYSKRYYFLCPSCNRKAVILYAGEKFYCRRCYGLTYESCRESHSSYHGRLGLSDSQYRNFMKVAEYSQELETNKRAGVRMFKRLQRYIDKSGVTFTGCRET